MQGTPLTVLQELWKDDYSGPKHGLTTNALAELVGVTAVAVNDAIRMLKGPPRPLIVDSGLVATDGARRGKRATVYRINTDIVISWPTTAACVLHLIAKPGATQEYRLMVDELLQRGLIDPYRNQPFTAAHIENQISFAEKREYLTRVSHNPDLVCLGPRVREERAYLEFVAKQIPAGA